MISEAVSFVRQRLPDDIATRLDDAKVQRILEWEVYYLQGLAHAQPQDTIAGGDDGGNRLRGRRDHGSGTGWNTAARTSQQCCVSRPSTSSPSGR